MFRISKVVLIVFLIVPLIVISQSRKEMKKNWTILETGSPEERIKSAGILHEFYTGENIDSIKVVGEKLFYYAIDNNDYLCLEEAKIILSESMIFEKKSKEAISILKSLLIKTEKRNDLIQSSRICSQISEAYLYLNDGKIALIWSKKAQILTYEYPLKERLKGRIILAESYLKMNKQNQGIKILKQLVNDYKKLKDIRRLGVIYGILGRVYLNNLDYSKSSFYFKESYKIATKLNLKIPIAHSINNLAIIDYEKGNFSDAKIKFFNALEIRLKTNDSKAISESYYNLGDFYFYQNDLQNAKKWYLKSEDYSKKKNLITEQIDALKALTQISKSTKDYEEACLLFDEILTAQKKQIDLKSKIDDDWAEINRQIIISENKEEIFNKSNQYKPILEWILISILGMFVVFLSLRMRKSSLNDPGKSSEN